MRDAIGRSPETLHLIKPEQAWSYRIIPEQEEGALLHLSYDEASDAAALKEELEIILNRDIKLQSLESAEIERLLNTYYFKNNRIGGGEAKASQIDSRQADFLPELILEARQLKSSDIHIETYDEKCRIRVRIDGNLVERYLVQKNLYPALINKIKIMANLDIAEKRLPQDGRINFKKGELSFDIRVSVLPTLYGEKIVLRLLSQDATHIELSSLGLRNEDLYNYTEGIKRPNGMVLISGPTGSGKTTTLYATLKLLNKESRNVLTIEDPIEYTLDGINQVQLKEDIGLSFASALRTFLRQDPDVIMVGEIRDAETANMAVRASLTGHLVLSTIHTNSAWGTVSRLVDMNIPPFLLSGTLNTTVAQRLVRSLCKHCRKEEKLSTQLYPRSFTPFYKVAAHYIACGCEHCYYTGYSGRRAIYEVITIDHGLAAEIRNGNMNVNDLLRERKIRTLAENAFELFASGETSLDEIYPLLFN